MLVGGSHWEWNQSFSISGKIIAIYQKRTECSCCVLQIRLHQIHLQSPRPLRLLGASLGIGFFTVQGYREKTRSVNLPLQSVY